MCLCKKDNSIKFDDCDMYLCCYMFVYNRLFVIHLNLFACMYVCLCMNACVHVCVYICVCVCVCVCV